MIMTDTDNYYDTALMTDVELLAEAQSYVLGLDVNRNQWDWRGDQIQDVEAIKASGREFVILEAVWGLDVMPHFKDWYPRFIDRGFFVMAYGFMNGSLPGDRQANLLLDTVRPMWERAGYISPLWYDVERFNGDLSSLAQRRAAVIAWMNAIRRVTRAGMYSRKGSWTTMVANMAIESDMLGWVASYNPLHIEPDIPIGWTREQTLFQQEGLANSTSHQWVQPIPGVSGDVSSDKFFGTLEQLWALAHVSVPEPDPEPIPDPGDDDMTKDEIILGLQAVRSKAREIEDAVADLIGSVIDLDTGGGTPPPPPPPPPPATDETVMMEIKEDPRAKTWCFQVWNSNQGRLVEKRNGSQFPIMQEYLTEGGKRLTYNKGVQVRLLPDLVNADGSVDYMELYKVFGDHGQRLFIKRPDLMKLD